MFNTLLMQGGSQGASGASSLIMMVLVIVVFYFFMIRPQQKKAKDEKNFREGLKKGDKIVTIGGIHGKILEIRETSFIIETEGGGKLKIERNAVSMSFTGSLTDETPAT
ncbi:MAG: preprotein translocase subunit YajC [Bacteroidia bacterium]|nr:preprotein translocase subunit YajC [Bacteroidia bacterium]